jgi:hypothetical protein
MITIPTIQKRITSSWLGGGIGRFTSASPVFLIVIDRDHGDRINDRVIRIVRASGSGVAHSEPELVFARRGQAVPYRTRAVPQEAPVGTSKAGISTDNKLKAAILLANDASSSLVVLRAESQDRFAGTS